MLYFAAKYKSLLFAFVGVFGVVTISVNAFSFYKESREPAIKILPHAKIVEIDSAKALDEKWRAKVAKQRAEEARGKQELIWKADIKRELHSMREGARLFGRINRDIEKERREKARQERIRIQKEHAAERKRIREEKAAERKKLLEEKKAKRRLK